MKKATYSSFFLLSLILIMSSSNALAINEGAPVWALDPTTHSQYLADYDLIVANDSLGSSFVSGYVSITGWYQVWAGPKGCMDAGPCEVIVAIAYMEMSVEIPQMAIGYLDDAFMSELGFVDITSQVPNAAIAFMYNGTGGFYIGMAIFNTRKHIISVAQYNSTWTPTGGSAKSPIETSAKEGDDATQDLMIACGHAVGALSIPGYHLLIFLGIGGVVSVGYIVRKKHRK